MRCFYYSERWSVGVNTLTGKSSNDVVVPWNRDIPPLPDEAPGHTPEINLVALDLSERGRVNGLVETFVVGKPWSQLSRKQGFGMDPPFKRMRPPRAAVVEMCTEQTRTFGFFARKDVFVAHIIARSEDTHANKELYAKYGDEMLQFMSRIRAVDKDESTDISKLIGDS